MWVSSIGNHFAYELQLFGRFGASQKVTKLGKNIFLLLDAVSQCQLQARHSFSSDFFFTRDLPFMRVLMGGSRSYFILKLWPSYLITW